MELGSVWRRLGSAVTVVEYLDRICPGVDEEAAKALQRALTKQGLDFQLQSKVVRADESSEGVRLAVERTAGGDAMSLQADYVLVAVGRRPYTEGLGLENVGIAPDERGLLFNDGHRTKVDGLWVIGDVTSGPMLAHKAEQEAIACIELIAGQAGKVNYGVIPNVIYTKPELADVGKSEGELKEKV